MAILNEINAKYITAMKEKDAETKNILSVVKNKIMIENINKRAENKELTDAEIISIIQKSVKELEEEIKGFESAGRREQVASLQKQKDVLSGFLPEMMSEDEIKKVIDSLEEKTLPAIMAHFKKNFAGKCDMSIVSRIARELNK